MARTEYKIKPDGIARIRAGQRRYIARNPAKTKVHNALNNAVRDGKIIQPENCDNCGSPGRIEGHHDDYAKPLDVRWLCHPCHVAHHKTERARKRQERMAT